MSEVRTAIKIEIEKETKKNEKIEKIKRAIWIHDRLIERHPELYKTLKNNYKEVKGE